MFVRDLETYIHDYLRFWKYYHWLSQPNSVKTYFSTSKIYFLLYVDYIKGSFTYYVIIKGEGGFGMITLM